MCHIQCPIGRFRQAFVKISAMCCVYSVRSRSVETLDKQVVSKERHISVVSKSFHSVGQLIVLVVVGPNPGSVGVDRLISINRSYRIVLVSCDAMYHQSCERTTICLSLRI